MAQFVEVFRCAGVDEEAIPNPGMIIERGSSNIVALTDGQGLHIDWSNKGIDIEELRDTKLIIQQRIDASAVKFGICPRLECDAGERQ